MFQTFAGFVAGNISFGRAQLDTMLNAGQAKRCPQWRRENQESDENDEAFSAFVPSYLMVSERNDGESSESSDENTKCDRLGISWDAILVKNPSDLRSA